VDNSIELLEIKEHELWLGEFYHCADRRRSNFAERESHGRNFCVSMFCDLIEGR
jgi:hypothetical protein